MTDHNDHVKCSINEADILINLLYLDVLGNGWLFSHEAGHCIGGAHLKPSGSYKLNIYFRCERG